MLHATQGLSLTSLAFLINKGVSDFRRSFNGFSSSLGEYIDSILVQKRNINDSIKLESVDLDRESDKFVIVPVKNKVVVGVGKYVDCGHQLS